MACLRSLSPHVGCGFKALGICWCLHSSVLQFLSLTSALRSRLGDLKGHPPPTRLSFFRFPPLYHLKRVSGQGSRAFCDHSSDIPWVPMWGPLYCSHSKILSLHVVTVSSVRPALLSIPAVLFSLITLLPSWAFVCLDTLSL